MNTVTARQHAYRQWRQAVITAHKEGVWLHRPWREQFENFLHDLGEPPAGKKLRRRVADGPFSPGNCEWA